MPRAWIVRTGRAISGLLVSLLLLDAAGKLLELAPVVEGTTQLGYPASVVVTLGVLQLVCAMTYAVPTTSVLGAVLLTGYFGGAVATHVRVGDPLVSHTLVPVYFGVLAWGALFLRDERVRALLPLRRGEAARPAAAGSAAARPAAAQPAATGQPDAFRGASRGRVDPAPARSSYQ
ncbi:MAG: DoxX family protein [Vicinamibacteraceae bacterium]|nr:DoxX family protein [Vicinamibacteraceae bacterium]